MGQIGITILRKPNEYTLGRVSSSELTNTNCFKRYFIGAKVSVTAWIEFVASAQPEMTIFKTSPTGPFVYEESINPTETEWIVEFHGYISPNATLNTQTSTLTINLYDSQGGTLIDTEVITHFHSQLFC